jgi:SsrA-binding protein
MKVVATNRKARHEYTVIDKFEAGVALMGTEVKSLREGRVNMKDSFAILDGAEMILKGLHISPYSHTSQRELNPRRDRKLLLHKREIRKLIGRVHEKGLTLVPLRIYFNERGIAKVEIAIARGKKTYDKRRDIADRDAQRDLQRELKDRD